MTTIFDNQPLPVSDAPALEPQLLPSARRYALGTSLLTQLGKTSEARISSMCFD